MTNEIKTLLQQKNATLVAHYYVASELQDLAEETGGFVGDSLEMARFGKNSNADIIIVAGVRFMGETAKILSPEKKVLVLDKNATCSLDEGCDATKFSEFCKQHPDREVVVYANTSAQVKAIADWMVTSSIAVRVVNHLKNQNKKIIWAPDKHLGNYVKEQTNADMLLWDGSCIVHEKFKAEGILNLKNKYPDAKILVHPESPKEVIKVADFVGSTTGIINFCQQDLATIFIIATENGIFHKIKQLRPDAKIIEAPRMGESAECESCAICEWMKLNNMEKLLNTLKNETNEIILDNQVITQAQQSIIKLLEFTHKQGQ
jgi:quinolinate synthase